MARTPLRALYRRNLRDVVSAVYGNSMRWRRFAYRITRSALIKAALSETQGGLCPACGEVIGLGGRDQAVTHHLTYAHACTAPSPEAKKPKWTCDLCFSAAPEHARRCLKRLRLLHPACHRDLHREERADSDWRATVGAPLDLIERPRSMPTSPFPTQQTGETHVGSHRI